MNVSEKVPIGICSSMFLLSFRVLFRHFKALTDKVPWVEMLGAAIRGERVELFESVAQVMGNGVRPV